MITSIDIKKSIKNILYDLGFFSTPDFLIIGAQKAGTTALFSHIIRHPQIVEPAFKEAHFFDKKENYIKGYKSYYDNFRLSFQVGKDQLIFEATPDYLFFPECAELIHKFNPDLKLIVVLRDPIQRAFSAWNMFHHRFKNDSRHKWMYDPRSFEEAINQELVGRNSDLIYYYLKRGEYADQIIRFKEFFSDDRLLILESDHLENQTKLTLEKVSSFLGITSFNSLNQKEKLKWTNQGDYQETLDPNLKEKMIEYFRVPDRKLEHLLGYATYWMELSK